MSAAETATLAAEWDGRIKTNCHIAGESFSYDIGTTLDWPGGVAEAARYCVLGRATPVGPDDKPLPIIGEFADRLWAASGLRRPKAHPARPAPETAALHPAEETAALPAGQARRPARGRPPRPAAPDDGPELSEDD